MSVISVDNVKKKFRVYYDKGSTLKEKTIFKTRNRHEDRWVLNGVSFHVEKGEAIGLIGQNGCGKSTMLKLLSKIMYPDEGSIQIKGRVSSLIELGAGFHPDMSGRENIYTNASIFGLSRAEIDERIDKIIEFAELGTFIDSPVRIYSSGMYMRLAFSVAVNVDADVLLVDEILAVGDASFQVKCFNKLQEIKQKGTTIVIVSHALGQIEQFCDRSYWICDGLIRAEGSPREVHPLYLQYMATKEGESIPEAIDKPKDEGEKPEKVQEAIQTEEEKKDDLFSAQHFGTKKAHIEKVSLLDHNGMVSSRIQTGEPCTVRIDYSFLKDVNNPFCGIAIHRTDGVRCYGTNTDIDRFGWKPQKQGSLSILISDCTLLQGEYTIDAAITEAGGFDCDYFKSAVKFEVISISGEVGIASLPHHWVEDAVDNQIK